MDRIYALDKRRRFLLDRRFQFIRRGQRIQEFRFKLRNGLFAPSYLTASRNSDAVTVAEVNVSVLDCRNEKIMLASVISVVNENVSGFQSVKRIGFCPLPSRHPIRVISEFQNKSPTLDGIFKTVAAASSIPTASAVMRAGFIRPTVGVIRTRAVVPILSVRKFFHKFRDRKRLCLRL